MSFKDRFMKSDKLIHDIERMEHPSDVPKPVEVKSEPEEYKERSIETAINKIVRGESWDALYNDIIDKPTKEGFIAKNFGSKMIDLKWFEDYMIKALPLVNLKNVLLYKSVRFFTDKKGYRRYER